MRFPRRVFMTGKKCGELMEGKRRIRGRGAQGWEREKFFSRFGRCVAEQEPREVGRRVRSWEGQRG